MQIELDVIDAIHLSTVVLFEAKKKIKNYKYFSYNPKIADIFRQDALQCFKIYKTIRNTIKGGTL